MKQIVYGKSAEGEKLTTQWEFVLDWLKRKPGRAITSKEAIDKWGFTRLSAIVKQIEYHTHIVLKREDVQVKTRYGSRVWVTRYWYAE